MTEHRPRVGRPRALATALSIEKSAVALVNEHGYDGTTVDMICADAGVSQRTFFNHFPTKDAAIIGTAVPTLDEQRVRAFIAATDDELLGEAIGLVSLAALGAQHDRQLMVDRLRAVSSTPHLMQRQMEGFAAIEAELAEVIGYRLGRLAEPDETEAELADQALLTAHLIAGAMRFTATAAMRGGPEAIPAAIDRTRSTIAALLPKLGGRAGS